MKFLLKLFDITSRHHGDVRRYERGGIIQRIFTVILVTALAVLSLWLEDWSFSIFNIKHLENFAGGLFALLLFFCVLIATLDFCLLYAYIGISRAISGSLSKIIDKNERKRTRKKRVETSASDTQSNESSANGSSEAAAPVKRKVPAWLDAFVGVFSLLVCIALVVLVIRYPFH